jgi:hypothetical protein
MTEEDISKEITFILLKVNDYSWELIGKKMNNTLSEHYFFIKPFVGVMFDLPLICLWFVCFSRCCYIVVKQM